MLNSQHQSVYVSENSTQQLGIGIWKVKLPEMIDRPEIVTRTDLYNVELADFHQWTGSLNNNITHLIASELSHRLKTERVVISPWSSYRKNDYQVKVHINRFDGKLGGEVYLNGAWSLLNAQGNKEILREAFEFKQKTDGQGYSEMTEALSKLTIQLAEKISTAITAQKK